MEKKIYEIISVAVCFNLDYKMESSTIVWEQVSVVDLKGEMPKAFHVTNMSALE